MLSGKWRMKRNTLRSQTLWIVLFLGSTAVLGFTFGHSRGKDVRVVATSTTPTASKKAPTQSEPHAPTAIAIADPADVTKLSGREFVEALPSMEKLARSGNLNVARALYQSLGSCVGFRKQSDEEIRTQENESYARQREITQQIRTEHPDHSIKPPFDEDSLREAHERALKAAFDQRDLCTALTPQQIESRLDWIQLALDRRDRRTVLDVTAPGIISVRGIERVRNAERLVEIAELEQNDLNSLIATGDLTALGRAVYAYGMDGGILPHDPELAYAYAYAYALSLTGGTDNDSQRSANAQMMENFASGWGGYPPLTAQQIEAARAKGQALFQQCCANGTHH
jgi:hypothetical protein